MGFPKRLRQAVRGTKKRLFEIEKESRTVDANTGVSARTISRWLNGHHEPDEEKLRGLCGLYGWDFDTLVGDESEPPLFVEN
jgi:transcriptional regulator with XRE-family HTH domain